jgi:hypothetical protein
MFKMPPMLVTPGRKLVVGLIAVIALVVLAIPNAATPARKIVIYGANSGSKLTLTKRHHKILVKGNMARQHPRGCHFTRGHRRALCSARNIHMIEIQMGRSGDFVRVKKKMPVPVVVYLGPGRDKFIGNGERDFCYPGGARRNRCVGGPNNDVCITGNRNSDCVGGPGNDYCRHGRGSDGCWGGRGNDVCVMGPGEDGCHGGPGRDRLFGGRGADQLYGGPGFDYCNGQRGWGKSHHCDAGPRR